MAAVPASPTQASPSSQTAGLPDSQAGWVAQGALAAAGEYTCTHTRPWLNAVTGSLNDQIPEPGWYS
jgi:hypothetical protein